MSCTVCAHAAQHGCWPADHRGTHCRVCHRSWAASKQAHCGACHRHFSTLANFDRHHRWVELADGSRRLTCDDPGALRTRAGERVLIEGADGVWRAPSTDRPGSLR